MDQSNQSDAQTLKNLALMCAGLGVLTVLIIIGTNVFF